MKKKAAPFLFAAISCSVIPIYGQTVGQNPDIQKKSRELQPYLSRLVSPESLPNFILCIAGIVGIVVGIKTLKAVKRQADIYDEQRKIMEGQLTEMRDTGKQLGQQIGVMRDQFKSMQEQTEATNKTLVLTQRPRIRVKAFYFSEIRGVGGVHRNFRGIEAGSSASGQFYIQNCGGTDARIREIWQEIYIASSLPMQRPYEGKNGSKEEKTLMPGDSSTYLFGLFQPLDSQTYADIMEFKNKNFYVLGWIGYTDSLGIYRRTAFCRIYDIAKDRFVPVDDPDYEYAD